MKMVYILAMLAIAACMTRPAAGGTADVQTWLAAHWGPENAEPANPPTPAFSFVLGGRPSAEVVAGSRFSRTVRVLDRGTKEYTCVYADAASGLEVRCAAVAYADFPAVEWKVYFKNTGTVDAPILENVQAMDSAFGDAGPTRLCYARGSHESPSDFEPLEHDLSEPLRLAPFGGRSSDGTLPFFNLLFPGGGVIIGIGWTGQWAASFEKTGGTGVRVRAGMEQTHLRLHPGEEIQTPAMLLLFWSGDDRVRGQNLLRRLLLAHYTPRPNGMPIVPPIGASPHGTIGFTDTTEANMRQGIQNIAEQRFPADTWWIDAGWHGEDKNWAKNPGTWTPNPERFPNGLKPVGDAAHAAGLRFLLWCEPERVMRDTWLHRNHREWLLEPAGLPPELQYQETDGFYLLNLGQPEARAWAKTMISALIHETGIDIYRQDFNMTPLYYWRNGEAGDRQGINEIRYVTGLYDLYDALLREHPGLIIDNCASGGRRIDFEIMRRALSLWRTDCCWDPIGEQSMTYAISFWMPITGVGAISTDPYLFRSGMGAHMSLALDFYNKPEWAQATEMLRQYQRVRHLFTADYYPLTPYSLTKDTVIAWQYHSPENGEGIVQAFRRDACPADSIQVRLQGLDPQRRYRLENFDSTTPEDQSGAELMDAGLAVRLTSAPAAALIHYTTINDRP